MLKTNINNIPEFLKKNAKWAVSEGGIPKNPLTGIGMRNEEAMTFEEVMANVGNYEYLAFRVEKDLGMGFIDLDAHSEEEEKQLKAILGSFKRYFDSYFELSKSGNGYHILVFTDIDKTYKTQANSIDGKNRMPIEFYADKKWCTITGNIIDDKYEIKNNDNSLNQMLSRFFSEREEYVEGKGVVEGDKVRSNEEVIRLVENDKFLSNLWNNKISNIITRKGEKVSYNNHTADFILIRGIMFYCNANKEQAREVYKESKKYKAYPKGYKREVDITNAINDSLQSLEKVSQTKEELISSHTKTIEERAIELEEKLMTLSEEEQVIMNQIDNLFDITEEEKISSDIDSLDVRTVKPYVNRINSLQLKEIVNTYIMKREQNNDFIVRFMPNSNLYTTSISDLAKLTNFATNNEIFYSKSKESFVSFNGKYWEEKDESMLLASVHNALNIMYDNAFKSVLDLVDIFKEMDYAVQAYKASEDTDEDGKEYQKILKNYDKRIASAEKFILGKFTKVLKILESNKTPTDVINYLASEVAIDFVPYEKTDYLNFQNGTLNLRTGEFKDFDKDDRLTNILGCDYDPNAKCPTFDKFLHSLFNTKETETQLLKAFASCLVKDATPKHKKYFFLLQGPTGTGKTTLINTLLQLMGSYGKSSKYQTFMKTNKEYSGASHNQDIFELIGKQFITCSEPSDTSVFAADFLKAFTGGSNLSIRAAYGHKFVNFKNTGLLFIDSNFTPKIATFDQAAMDRFQVFPMVKTPDEKDRDDNLGAKLEAELSGIFNRINEVLKDLDNSPFKASKEMEDYKNQYKQESSDICQWYTESLELTDTNSTIPFIKIYQSYEGWCKVNNKTPLSKAFFSSRVKDEVGLSGYKKSGQIVVSGFVFTKVGKVYSDYNNFDKKSDFYKELDKVTRPDVGSSDTELSYRSLRQQILSKTANWFAEYVKFNGDLREQKAKYNDYVQYCIWQMCIHLCQQDFNCIIDYMLTEMNVKDVVKMANGDFDAKMLLAEEVRKISIVSFKKSA